MTKIQCVRYVITQYHFNSFCFTYNTSHNYKINVCIQICNTSLSSSAAIDESQVSYQPFIFSRFPSGDLLPTSELTSGSTLIKDNKWVIVGHTKTTEKLDEETVRKEINYTFDVSKMLNSKKHATHNHSKLSFVLCMHI